MSKTVNDFDWRSLAERAGWRENPGVLSELTVAQNQVVGETQMYNSADPAERSPLGKIVAIAMVAIHATTAARMNKRSMSNAKNDIYKCLKNAGVGVEAVWKAANAITATMRKEERDWEAYKAIWGEPAPSAPPTEPEPLLAQESLAETLIEA